MGTIFLCISLYIFNNNWQKIWPVRGTGNSLSVFFLAIYWNSIALRKYLKQKMGFQKQSLFFASLSEHPGFMGLGLPLYFDCCCGPQFFQTLFLQTGTQDHCTYHRHRAGKSVSFRWHLIPHGLKTIFSMLGASLSISFQDCL